MDVRSRPPVKSDDVPKLVEKYFDMTVESVDEQTGYDDCNFKVKCGDSYFVLKVTNAADSAVPGLISELNETMKFIAQHGITVPEPVPLKDGSTVAMVQFDDGSVCEIYCIRLMRFIEGQLMRDVPLCHRLMYDVGSSLARLHIVTEKFDSEIIRNRNTIWSLFTVPHLIKLTPAVKDLSQREKALQVIKVFELAVIPVASQLPSLYLHSDPNEQNILVSRRSEDDPYSVCGILDFGDSYYGPRIFDVACACLYVMLHVTPENDQMLDYAYDVFKGYTSVLPLTDQEKKLLPKCIRARLVQSLVLGAASYERQPENEYVLTTSRVGWKLLQVLLSPSFGDWPDQRNPVRRDSEILISPYNP